MTGILSHDDAIARLMALRDAPPSALPWTMEDDGNDYVISAPEAAVEIARIPHAEGADTDALFLITAANTHRHALVTVAALHETLEATAQTITDLRNELEQLPEELRAGVGGCEPPKAAKSDEELNEALATVKAMGRWGGRSVYRRDESGTFEFVRHATQAEDDAWVTIFQTGLAAGWRTAAERDQARQQAEEAIAMLREIRRACIASVRGAEHAASVSVEELDAHLVSTPVDVANLIARAETAEAEVARLKAANESLEMDWLVANGQRVSLRGELDRVTLLAEDRRQIIEGTDGPPPDEVIRAHDGPWLIWDFGGGAGAPADRPLAREGNHALRTADHARRFGWKSRWWPLSRDRHPTARPIVESAEEAPRG